MEEVFSGVLPLLAIEGTEICSLRDTHSPKSKLALVELLRMHGMVLARQRRWDEAERLRGIGIGCPVRTLPVHRGGTCTSGV